VAAGHCAQMPWRRSQRTFLVARLWRRTALTGYGKFRPYTGFIDGETYCLFSVSAPALWWRRALHTSPRWLLGRRA
jgi:hypothetical protein